VDICFETRDIYDILESRKLMPSPYNVIVFQYMIAGHIYDGRADKIGFMFDKIIEKFIAMKPHGAPLLLIINDIDHKSWICDYYNLFTKKLRKCGFEFTANKRHFEEREDGVSAGSKLYKVRTNRFLADIPKGHREKYNAHAPCSASQLIIEVM